MSDIFRKAVVKLVKLHGYFSDIDVDGMLLSYLNDIDVDGILTYPPDDSMGDFALPCFTLAKKLRRKPAEIAMEITDILQHGLDRAKQPGLENFLSLLENEYDDATPNRPDDDSPAEKSSAEGSGPGMGLKQLDSFTIQSMRLYPMIERLSADGPYVNFFIDKKQLVSHVIKSVSETKSNYGKSSANAGKTVVIDFSSPNIAKPFGVGHLRSTVIGAALYRIFESLGYKCVGINFFGDWGTQFGNIICAYKKWGNPGADITVEYLTELYVRFHEEAENNGTLEDEGRDWFRKLENGDCEAVGLWKKFREISIREFEKIYLLLGVRFDEYSGESFFVDRTDEAIKLAESKGLLKMSEGARIIDLSEFGMSPCILVKSDGATKYETRDLAAILFRKQEYDFSRIVYVVGADQKEYFQKLFKVIELMSLGWAGECHHAYFGLIRFKGDKMSTRRGRNVLLEDVIEKAIDITRDILKDRELDESRKEEIARAVGISAVVFNDLKNRRIKDVDFDWDTVLAYDPDTKAFKGETGPYVQYTYTRLSSLLRKYGDEVDFCADPLLLKENDEFLICKKISRFAGVIQKAADEFEPSLIASYLLELCAAVNQYWHNHRVIDENAPDLTTSRVLLCWCLRTVIGSCMDILGITRLEEM